MNFEQKNLIEEFGERVGYIFAYFLFTAILLLVLEVLNKIPSSWSYLHIIGITLLITFGGSLNKRLLE